MVHRESINEDEHQFLLSEFIDHNKLLRRFWDVYKDKNNSSSEEEKINELIESIQMFLIKHNRKVSGGLNKEKKTSFERTKGEAGELVKNILKIGGSGKEKVTDVLSVLEKNSVIDGGMKKELNGKIGENIVYFDNALKILKFKQNFDDFLETILLQNSTKPEKDSNITEIKEDPKNEDKEKEANSKKNSADSGDKTIKLLNEIINDFSDEDKKILLEAYNTEKGNKMIKGVLGNYSEENRIDTIDSLEIIVKKEKKKKKIII